MNKMVAFGVLLLLFSTLLVNAEEIMLDGTWMRYRYSSIDTSTGEIEWEKDKEYIFLDEIWVRIETPDARHEYKYEMKNNFLKIGKETYTILGKSEGELRVVGAWDIVGDLLISTRYAYKFSKKEE